jgi:hypothetical protein
VCALAAALLASDVPDPPDALALDALVAAVAVEVDVLEVLALSAVPAVVEPLAPTTVAVGLAALDVSRLCCSANAPPVPRNSSMLSAPVTRRAPRAGCGRCRRVVMP